MRSHLVVVYGGGGFRGKLGGVEWRGVTSKSLPGTCAGDDDSAGSHRGGMAAMPPPDSPATH